MAAYVQQYGQPGGPPPVTQGMGVRPPVGGGYPPQSHNPNPSQYAQGGTQGHGHHHPPANQPYQEPNRQVYPSPPLDSSEKRKVHPIEEEEGTSIG